MDSPDERRAWIDEMTADRRFGSGLTIESAPVFSVKDSAAREALAAYVLGAERVRSAHCLRSL